LGIVGTGRISKLTKYSAAEFIETAATLFSLVIIISDLYRQNRTGELP